jgi:predicted RecB family nuclease
MRSVFHADDFAAYCHCPRKAFLLLSGPPANSPHEYVQVVAAAASENASSYLTTLAAAASAAGHSVAEDIRSEAEVIIRPTIQFGNLTASPDALLATASNVSRRGVHYEPVLVVGTYRLESEHRHRLNYIGYLLAQLQESPPARGFVIAEDGKRHSVKLDATHRVVESTIATLRNWTSQSKSVEPEPRVVLNDHCPCCPFRNQCEAQALQADDLSLLDRITPKMLRRYHKKGIFTVNQLSYVFRPRRFRKFPRSKAAVFNVELQALAIRTGKIYLQQVPALKRNGIEIFLDVEGIPDNGTYYLFGALVSNSESNTATYHPYWADAQQEREAFAALVSKLAEYPDAPIYHYGRYEKQAFTILERRHGVACNSIRDRLVNISASIYGKVYFPVRSNNLKELGRYLGATWSSPEASGLQSLVWRHHWEASSADCYKQMLLTYNEEDCRALILLTNELTKVAETADSNLSNIDFADRPKQACTEVAEEIHNRFDAILKFASADYPKRKLSLRKIPGESEPKEKKRGPPKGHQAYQRIIPVRAGRVIRVQPKRLCPKHKGQVLVKGGEAQKTVIDLVFGKSGCRKTVTRYVGPKAYCERCKVHYAPPSIGSSHQLFGRGFQAWTIHQRIVLRLPYRVITQCMEDLFGERTAEGTIISFMSHFADDHAATERRLVRQILSGPFVHVDETRLNIQGVDHYVWVFTDGRHVFFRLTESRESAIVHDILSGYTGVLISDFYPGYDAVKCRQQKCWVHLIRDINEDLWKAPGDMEFELFVREVRNLVMPIFETVERYGVKRCHLERFLKPVDQFYESAILGRAYSSEYVLKYQKRFERYREELFLFLQQDGLPWNNNMGERAIRQLAVQRKISGSFYKKSASHYLLLLGIAQTCRFQEKSFLKFLLSGEKDVDLFKGARRKRISQPMIRMEEG